MKIDLSKAPAGKQSHVITAEKTRLPRNVNRTDAVPPRVELTLGEIADFPGHLLREISTQVTILRYEQLDLKSLIRYDPIGYMIFLIFQGYLS